MLRISVDDTPDLLTIKLEGKVRGPWGRELEKVWYSVSGVAEHKRVRIDLCHVSSIDDCGKGVLVMMCQKGVEFEAIGPMMTAMVEEVRHLAGKERQRFRVAQSR